MCGSSTQESSGPYDNIIFFLAPVRTNDALFVHISDSREAQVNIFAMQALEIIGIVDEAFASELKNLFVSLLFPDHMYRQSYLQDTLGSTSRGIFREL